MRPAQGDDPLRIEPPGGEQTADGDDILVVQMPHRTSLTDGIEKMNMGAHQPGGMGAGKLGDRQLGEEIRYGQGAARRFAHEQRHPHARQHLQSQCEGRLAPLHHQRGIGT